MGVFKPTIHRKSFIDKKIRGNSFPTAVTIATDYSKESGRKVDPRTIAADIASLKHDYNAPISYDYQKRGYYYSDPSFHLNLLPSKGTGIPLDNLVPEAFPPSAFLPEWQQKLLSSMVAKLIPVTEKESPLAGKISILLGSDQDSSVRPHETAIITALRSNKLITVEYLISDTHKTIHHFQPIQLICTAKEPLLFGLDITTPNPEYHLFSSSCITAVSIESKKMTAPQFVYVQSTNNNDIEILLSDSNKDIILVFSTSKTKAGKKQLPEYSLLAKTDLYHS